MTDATQYHTPAGANSAQPPVLSSLNAASPTPQNPTRPNTFAPPLLPPDTPSLSPRQLTAITLLLAGRTDASVASAIGVSRWTVSRWQNHHPAFIAEFNRRRRQLYTAASQRIQVLLLQSLDVLARQLKDKWEPTRQSTAKSILRFAGQPHLAPPAGSTSPDAVLHDLRRLGLAIAPDDSPPSQITAPPDDIEDDSQPLTSAVSAPPSAAPTPPLNPAARSYLCDSPASASR